ncbi:MAG TPA: hypothetical protein PLW42_00705 [Anaerohalosphaeraceae bacterium]|nr:hypothetical protein [Anaerohalosphaeraceae bacterium]HQJ66872.1 hypothetical protein [Anaerohalosphaeraceae bacterium]
MKQRVVGGKYLSNAFTHLLKFRLDRKCNGSPVLIFRSRCGL